MAEIDEMFHQDDNIALTDNFDFSQSIFDLQEPNFTPLGDDFKTPSSIINQTFLGYENLLKFGHINACSIPKHHHEVEKIIKLFDVLGVCESFITPNTPRAAFEITGYNFFHVDRISKSRGGVACYVSDQFHAKQIKLPVDLYDFFSMCISP